MCYNSNTLVNDGTSKRVALYAFNVWYEETKNNNNEADVTEIIILFPRH